MPDVRNDLTDASPMAVEHAAHHNALADAVNATVGGVTGADGAEGPAGPTGPAGADGVAELTSPDGHVYAVVVADDGTLGTEVLSVPPPVVTGVEPDSGPESGGTAVTITGRNFVDVIDVMINAQGGLSHVVVSDTEITSVTPAGSAAEAGRVIIHAAGGPSIDPVDFTYVPDVPDVPAETTITGIDPATVATSADGGEATITGTGFRMVVTDASYVKAVSLGTAQASSIVVVDDTTITCQLPTGDASGQTGPVDVALRIDAVFGGDPLGEIVATLAGGFTYPA
jgi:hypothetical protein